MNSPTAKPPREYWLAPFDCGDCFTEWAVSETGPPKIYPDVRSIHVIEKSYADKLEQELADVRKELDERDRDGHLLRSLSQERDKACDERDQAQAMAERLAELLDSLRQYVFSVEIDDALAAYREFLKECGR